MINKEESIKKYFTILLNKKWVAVSDVKSKSQFILDFNTKEWIVELSDDGICWIQNELIEDFDLLYNTGHLKMQKIIKSIVAELFCMNIERSIAGIFKVASGAPIPYEY